MDMNILKYMAFIKTVESGSFTKAAELLNYSQSGISRMINDLEKEWKVSLLERNRAGVRLTSDGIKLLPFAQKVVNEYNLLQTEVAQLNGLEAGFIRIATFSSVATHWLPNMIKEFQKDYPNIDYEILLGDYNEIEQWIIEGRVDCGFLRLPASSELETFFVEQDRLLAVLPANHRLANCDKFPLSAFREKPFMMLEKGGAQADAAKIFEDCGIKPEIRFTTWDDYSIMSMVEKGLGISILPELILKRVPYHIVTKELEIPAYRNIGLAMREKKTASAAVTRFIDYLKFRNL